MYHQFLVCLIYPESGRAGAKHLGVMISYRVLIGKVSTTAITTRKFARRTVKLKAKRSKKLLITTFVRPLLEYCSPMQWAWKIKSLTYKWHQSHTITYQNQLSAEVHDQALWLFYNYPAALNIRKLWKMVNSYHRTVFLLLFFFFVVVVVVDVFFFFFFFFFFASIR